MAASLTSVPPPIRNHKTLKHCCSYLLAWKPNSCACQHSCKKIHKLRPVPKWTTSHNWEKKAGCKRFIPKLPDSAQMINWPNQHVQCLQELRVSLFTPHENSWQASLLWKASWYPDLPTHTVQKSRTLKFCCSGLLAYDQQTMQFITPANNVKRDQCPNGQQATIVKNFYI